MQEFCTILDFWKKAKFLFYPFVFLRKQSKYGKMQKNIFNIIDRKIFYFILLYTVFNNNNKNKLLYSPFACVFCPRQKWWGRYWLKVRLVLVLIFILLYFFYLFIYGVTKQNYKGVGALQIPTMREKNS